MRKRSHAPAGAGAKLRLSGSLCAVLLGAGLLSSCVPLTHYRPALSTCDGIPQSCGRSAVHTTNEYLLGFVEFDDFGWSWDLQQQETVLAAIEREAEQGDVLIVVFAHGWRHDASPCDTNVECLRQTLVELDKAEKQLAKVRSAEYQTPRRIVGVYLGWRGRSARALQTLTFFGRKSTAEDVGSGAVTDLLVRLKSIRERKGSESSSRLIIVGHSFGAALVYSATSSFLMERLSIADTLEEEARGFGDLLLLVNPAFEAARYQPLHERQMRREFPKTQRPLLAIVTSRADKATRWAFPIGRFFSTLLDKYSDGQDHSPRDQRRANRSAIGHHEPYRTHRLVRNDGTCPPVDVNQRAMSSCGCPYGVGSGSGDRCSALAQAEEDDTRADKVLGRLRRQEDAGLDLVFPQATLKSLVGDAALPLLNIYTERDIIASHSDIYQPAFIDFLRHFIMLNAEPDPTMGRSPAVVSSQDGAATAHQASQ